MEHAFLYTTAVEHRLIYVTCSSKEEAESIGRTLVEERLVACVNIIDSSKSIYRWKGKIEAEKEAILFAKTTEERVPALIERVKELHSYECPCIVVLPILEGNKQYLEWMSESCS